MNNRIKELLRFTWLLKKTYENHLESVLTKHKLTQAEGNILLFMTNNDFNTAKEISEYRSISKSLISKSINHLEKRKLLYSKHDSKDKRINRLYITSNANEIIDDLKNAQEDFYKTVQYGISEDNLEVFDEILENLYTNVNKNFKL